MNLYKELFVGEQYKAVEINSTVEFDGQKGGEKQNLFKSVREPSKPLCLKVANCLSALIPPPTLLSLNESSKWNICHKKAPYTGLSVKVTNWPSVSILFSYCVWDS